MKKLLREIGFAFWIVAIGITIIDICVWTYAINWRKDFCKSMNNR